MKHPEQDLQIAVANFLRVSAPRLLWWATPNAINMKGGARAGAFNKAMGVLPGVADLIFILPRVGRNGVSGHPAFIELKAEGGRMEPSQHVFKSDVEALGCPYVVCRSLDDVQETLLEWGVELRARAT